MQINNPFQMNDWEIKRFLRIVLAMQLAMWGAIGVDFIGLQIPIIRQFIGFIYLTFIPGIIILRVLKLHKLGNIETLLYTVGLSIATLMFTGLLMNTVYPLLGIYGPISITPLIITISAVVLILCFLCYIRDKDFSDPDFIDIKDVLSQPALFLYLIPLLAIFGTYLVNFHRNNILLMLMIGVITSIVLLKYDTFIPKKLYPLAIFIIAFSLLLHNSLISMHIWGWDIHVEYYIANLVITNSLWDSTIPFTVNAMLSITMLVPIFSNILGLSLTWVFKIIYPLLFALVPLGLYRVFQKQTDDKIAFLSVFFFMSIFTFYTEMLALARQQIAELFLVLMILLLFDKNMNKMKRSMLLIIFALSLIVSHYGISYVFMASLIVVWFLLYLESKYQSKEMISTITSPLVLLYITFGITWYIYISSSSTFNSIVFIGDHIAGSITDLLNPESAEGMSIIGTETTSSLHAVTKYLHLIAQFFIFVGILALLLNRSKIKFDREYSAFSGVNFMILLAAIGVPFFASSIATTRLYHISLIFLAPFFVIGGLTIFNVVDNIAKAFRMEQSIKNPDKIFSLFLAIFLLFNSGWVYEVAHDSPTSFSLNTTIDFPRFNEQEFLGANWLYNVKGSNPIYADYYRWLLLGSLEWGSVRTFPVDINKTQYNSYIYLGNLNVEKEEILVGGVTPARRVIIEYVNSSIIVDGRDKIYDNTGAQVYY